jgi:gliding motility-associated-like protein
LLFILLSYNPKGLYAQRSNYWFFADSAGIKFGASQPTSVGNGSLGNGQLASSCTTMSDTSGNLLFYTNGMDIWNAQHQVMTNGGGISNVPNLSNVVGQVISLPMPNNDSLYYLFYNKSILGNSQYSLCYSIINIKKQNALGEVVQKNVVLQNQTNFGLSAITHRNGKDYWLITKYYYSPIFYTYRITDTGVTTIPIISDFSSNTPSITLSGHCTMKGSPDGNLIAVSPNYFFYFNSLNGQLSNPRKLGFNTTNSSGGFCFSPNSNRFYKEKGGNKIIQYYLGNLINTSSPFNYADSTEITYRSTTSSSDLRDMQIAPDGKIYAIRYNSTRLSCISRPNDSGYNCQFVDTALVLTKGYGFINLPHFMNNIHTPSLVLKVGQTGCKSFSFSFNSILQGATFKQWDFGDGSFSNDSVANHTFNINSDSILVRFSIVPIGSTDTLKMNRWVKLPKKPIADFSYQTNGCSNSPVTFNSNIVQLGNAGISSFTWLPQNGTAINGQQNLNHPFADTGHFYMKFWVTDSLGCTCDTVTKTIYINKKVKSSFTTSSPTCANSNLTVTNLSTSANTTITAWGYFLSNGQSVVKNIPDNLSWPIANAGSLLLKQVVSNTDGCVDSSTQNVTILDTPIVDAGSNMIVKLGNQAVLNATSTGNAVSFLWRPATFLSNATLQQPITSPTNDIVYTVWATLQNGCSSKDTVLVKVLSELIIPSAFSPNDDGINDTWEISQLNYYPYAKVWVYNRQGQTVFESYGYTKPWNGKRNSKHLPVGTYYYIIQTSSNSKPISGSVTLLK